MLKIRLQRVGRKHDPSYRVVLTDSKKAARSGAVIENLGFYNPRKSGGIKLDGEKIKQWMRNGAQVSGTVHNLLVEKKVISKSKINVLPKRKEVVKDEKAEVKTAEEPKVATEPEKVEPEKVEPEKEAAPVVQ